MPCLLRKDGKVPYIFLTNGAEVLFWACPREACPDDSQHFKGKR
jgi:type I site-specific restriction endonuclease